MKLEKLGRYEDIVRDVCGNATQIVQPKIPGSQQNVLMTDGVAGRIVFKFNNADLVMKNEAVSRLLQAADIPAPHVTAMVRDQYCFEVYPFIPGVTLYERVGAGMGHDQISAIFQELLGIQYRMSQIQAGAVLQMPCGTCAAASRATIVNSNDVVTAYVIAAMVRIMNLGKWANLGLYHYDLTPKNILISDQNKFAGLLDLDGVAVCEKHFALAAMAAKYEQLGGSVSNICDFYEALSHQSLNRSRIRAQVNLTNLGKKIMWHLAHKSKAR
ncbi:phosphotransferase [bacterium]|nr:phosphotransferase [bacterium]